MHTKVLFANDEAITAAVKALARGGLVAFPTDTVYGVGAHAFIPEAVDRIYKAKVRPREKAIPILIAKAEDLHLVAVEVPRTARLLIERFWPGGLTLVLPKNPSVPKEVSPGPTVAVRIPDNPIALAIIESLGAPMAVTSANISGHPSPVTAQEVEEELGGENRTYR